MAREKLDHEEAERRNRECRKRYTENHREEIREKNDRNAWQTQKRTGPSAENSIMQPWTSSLKLYEHLRPGRKRLYTPEEAVEVAKRQRHESYLRRQERLNAGRALLAQAEGEQ